MIYEIPEWNLFFLGKANLQMGQGANGIVLHLWLSNVLQDIVIKAWSETNNLLIAISFIIGNNKFTGRAASTKPSFPLVPPAVWGDVEGFMRDSPSCRQRMESWEYSCRSQKTSYTLMGQHWPVIQHHTTACTGHIIYLCMTTYLLFSCLLQNPFSLWGNSTNSW